MNTFENHFKKYYPHQEYDYYYNNSYNALSLEDEYEKITYSMKETCEKTNLTYDTLKFYCNEGLAPNVKRDKNNYCIFDDKDIAWINSFFCLKNCGMSIQEMKEYLKLCLKGKSSIPERKEILNLKLKELEHKKQEIQDSIDYINWKHKFYDDVLVGKTKYYSNLTNDEKGD